MAAREDKPNNMDCAVVDLFCGAGGLTHGFVQEGLRVVAGIDADPACQYPFERNNQGAVFVPIDVGEISGEGVLGLYGRCRFKILAGCAPCQPFSKYAQRYAEKDQDWALLHVFSDIALAVRPEVVTMENVPELQKHPLFRDFANSLAESGYHLSVNEVYCPDYGVPQGRRRLVVLASRLGPINLIPPTHDPTHYLTVRDAIGGLERLEAGQVSLQNRLHRASALSATNLRRIHSSRPGGSWRDWDVSLVADCHKKQTGATYSSVYGRMEWHQPAPTLTTQFYGFGNGRFGHPEQNRALSLLEGSLLQTFPPQYEFVPPGTQVVMKTLGRLIGNAVPVSLGRAIARSIKLHLEDHDA